MAEEPSGDTLFCTVHPTVETTLRCNKCNRPMCIKCARRTPVGYRCKECVRGQQQIFYNAQPLDLVLQGISSLVLGTIGAILVNMIGSLGFFGWIIAFMGSSAAGALIANIAHRVAGKRRARYSWLVVAAGIVLGAVVVAIVPILLYSIVYIQAIAGTDPELMADSLGGLGLMGLMGFANIGWWIYVIVATGAAISSLRMGR
ncbi:MAG: hypothetical protein JXB07_10935 [Anaerolineae bacterium]|nr:hypothetical protein [Anaerolineae bacterium]